MRHPQVTTALLLGTLAVFLGGCGRNPVSPQVSLPGQPGASSAGGLHSDDPPAPVEAQPGASAALSIAANGEGSVKVGRFSLKVHKNSLRNPVMITLTVADQDAMQVDIQVTPAEANDFQVPLELVADLSDRPDLNLDNQTIYWWADGWQAAEDVAVKHGDNTLKARTQQLMSAKVDRIAQGKKNRME